MRSLLTRWLLTSVPLVLFVSMLTFFLTSLVPGDAARAILGPQASPGMVAYMRRQLGLDQPLWEQYGHWLSGAVRGDFGTSVADQTPVLSDITARLPATLWLMGGALVVAAVAGVGLGLASALGGGILGRLADAASMTGSALPSFWFGLLVAVVFAVWLPLFPATFPADAQSPSQVLSAFVLPVVTLGVTSSAPVAKQTRDGVLSELGRPYVTMLRARGIAEHRIMLRHVLRNAAAPVVAVLGLVLAGLLGGAVLVETVFVVPGLGGLAVSATQAHDLPVIQGIAVVFTVIVAVISLGVELLQYLLNPKARA